MQLLGKSLTGEGILLLLAFLLPAGGNVDSGHDVQKPSTHWDPEVKTTG